MQTEHSMEMQRITKSVASLKPTQNVLNNIFWKSVNQSINQSTIL